MAELHENKGNIILDCDMTSLGEGNGNSLQYSCLENSMDKGNWQTTVYGVTRVGHNLVTKPRPS